MGYEDTCGVHSITGRAIIAIALTDIRSVAKVAVYTLAPILIPLAKATMSAELLCFP